MLKQRSPEWLEARRELVTATDIPVLLGLSPYKSEGSLAREKRGEAEPGEATLRMRIGLAVEPLIRDAYTEQTGRRLLRFHGMRWHPTIEWAAASPDYRAVGERRLVEAKWTGSRSRFADGLPQDIEAQVMWQLGVTGYPVADVAVLLADELRVFEVPFDAATFDGLVRVASDFRERLAAGGPFAENAASVRDRYPVDDGSEMTADDELTEAVTALNNVRAQIDDLEAIEDALKTAIKARMGEHAVLSGPGWHVVWRRTKDTEQVDWRAVAAGLLTTLPEPERAALVGLHTIVRPGFRPFRIVREETPE